MDNPLATIQEKLEALRQAYSQQLLSKVEQLTELWHLVTVDLPAAAFVSELSADPERIQRLHTFHRLAHMLRGSAATYGFTAVSHEARQLEEATKPYIQDNLPLTLEHSTHVDRLLSQLKKSALSSLETLPIPALPTAGETAQLHDPCPPAPIPSVGAQRQIVPVELQGVLLPKVRSEEDNAKEIWVSRVLIVDDDPDISQLLIGWLSAYGYEIAAVASGEAAEDWLNQFGCDVMFLDVLMPGISGLEVLKQIREQKLDIAVIMTKAFGSEQIAIDALRRGADDYLHKPFDPREFQAVLERTVARLELRRQNSVLRRQLQIELARAAEIQADLLPQEIPPLPGFQLAARCVPAREVGGDFYDWHKPSSDLFNLILGDVMGKGLPAALLMATVRASMRALCRDTEPVVNIRYAAKALEPDLMRSESFVTLFHAQLDIRQSILRYVDAGHGHTLMVRCNGSVQELGPRGVPLGAFPDETYCQGEIRFDAGDTLLVYSDGLIDAQPQFARHRMGLVQHLLGAGSAAEILERVIAIAQAGFVGPQTDDLTVLVLQRTPEL